jgi:Flagellar hook capping protein
MKMSSDAISSYLTTYNAATSNSTSSTSKSDSNTLDMDDFIKLLVAQLQNQDMYNTTDTTEFMSQMAQYSMVQAVNDLISQSAVASSFNLIGKGVTISSDSQTIMGVVDGVTLQNNTAKVVVNGNAYSMDDVKEVFDASLLSSS